ncbi:MAG: hypothetical protein IJK31_03250 [Ruminococcus sp.]|nr:hypothetical protein [Ruminococcus sp.]
MTDSMAKNAMLMKKYKKNCNRVGIAYMAGCGMYIFAATYLMILTVAGDVMFLFLDGIVFKGLILFFGYGGVYKLSDKFALAAPAVAFLNLGLEAATGGTNYMDVFLGEITGGGMAAFVFAVTVLLAAITLKANRDYRYLEQQEGFPQFNERFHEQNNAPKEYVPQFGQLCDEKKGSMDELPELPKDIGMDEL